MTPKEYKQMMDYLTRSGVRKQVKFASDIARPDPKPRVKEIELFNEFNKRNPKADGGRIGFDNGTNPRQGFQPGNKMNLLRKDGNPGNLKAMETYLKKLKEGKDKKVEKFKELVKKGDSPTEAKKKVIKLFKIKRSEKAGTPTWMKEGKKQLVEEGILEDKGRGKMKIIGETKDFSTDKNIERISRETVEQNIKKATYRNKTTGETFDKYKPLMRGNTVSVSGAGFDTLEEAKTVRDNYEKTNPKKMASTLKLEQDIKKLADNPRLERLLKTGTPDKKYLKVVQDILDLNVSQAEDKLKQLGEAVRPGSNFDVPGVNKINEKKAKNISNFYKSKSVSKKIIDEEIGRSVGEKSLKNLRSDVQRQLPFPGGPETFETDEAKAKKGSFRLGSKPYSIFGQVIDGRLNQGDKMAVDSQLSTLEESVQKALKGELFTKAGKKITPQEAVAKYNAAAMEAEKKFNAYKTRGFKSVRIPKISLKSPDKTILNKPAYEKYKPFFDDNYSKLGYSFEIPKDLKPIPEIAKLLRDKNSPEYKSMIKNIKEIGKKFIKNINEYDEKDLLKIFNNPKFQQFKRFIPRLVSNEDFSERRYASANNIMSDATFVDPVEEEKNFIQRNPFTTAAGTAAAAATTKTGRNILKRLTTGAFTPTGIALQTAGLGGLDLTTPAGRLSLGAEAAFAPELVKASIGATKGMKNRALQKGIQQILNLGLPTRLALRAARLASPIGIATLAGEGLYQGGKFAKQRFEELAAMSPEQRQELRSEGARQAFDPFQAAGGGIAKQAGVSSGPPPESGPNSQGLQGLMKRVRNL